MLKYLKCQTGVYLCVRVQDSFHRQRSPSLKREAYLLRLRRMKKYSKMPRKYWNISHLIHPKRWYLSLPLEGGGPRSGGRSLLFPTSNSPINHNLKQITLPCDQQRKTNKVLRYTPAGAYPQIIIWNYFDFIILDNSAKKCYNLKKRKGRT